MKRLVLALAVCAVACPSLLSRLETAQTALEYHQLRYVRVCCVAWKPDHTCAAMSAEHACVQYGQRVNDLSHVIDSVKGGLDGGRPTKLAKAELKAAQAEVELAAVP